MSDSTETKPTVDIEPKQELELEFEGVDYTDTENYGIYTKEEFESIAVSEIALDPTDDFWDSSDQAELDKEMEAYIKEKKSHGKSRSSLTTESNVTEKMTLNKPLSQWTKEDEEFAFESSLDACDDFWDEPDQEQLEQEGKKIMRELNLNG